MELLNHCMLDLETWGRTAGCAIRSIGAVLFNPATGTLGAEFYTNIEDRSCADFGLEKDPETEQWWQEQSEEASNALLHSQQPVDAAAAHFVSWWNTHKPAYIWGHGANFDVTIIEAVLRATGHEVPWSFWNVRCCRTVLAMARRKPSRQGCIHHYALDDAKAQARAVAAAFKQNTFAPN